MAETIYTEVTGTTCYVDGERGTVVQLLYAPGAMCATGAMVRLDEREAMLYLTLGKTAIANDGKWSQVREAREIDRGEFDNLTGITSMRRDMGWTL